MASLSGSVEVIRVALNSTIPDIDGAKYSRNTGEVEYGGWFAHMFESK